MSVQRQMNWRGQQRVDVPHLRAIESGVAGDFDVLAGNLIAGRTASVAKGFKIVTTGITGISASALQLQVAGSILVHYEASETGSVFQVPADRAVEVLSNSNSRVSGGWTFNAVNYIGIDLVRSADSTTSDTIMTLDPTTNQETPQIIPLARTLDYKIVISTTNFSASPGIAPVAKVSVSSTGTISGAGSITDCRSMLFSLASGGDSASETNVYGWPNGRTPGTVFSGGGDKAFSSLKDWMQGVMTRIWELGGGEKWYSQTADRNVFLCFGPHPNIAAGQLVENFNWDGTDLTWEGVSVAFDNSTGYYNTINDQITASAGLTNLVDGECIYVDIDRTANSTLTAKKAVWATLSGGGVPGSRFVIAGRKGSSVFVRNQPWAVGNAPVSLATDISPGLIQLSAGFATTTADYGLIKLDAAFAATAADYGLIKLAAAFAATAGDYGLINRSSAFKATDVLYGLIKTYTAPGADTIVPLIDSGTGIVACNGLSRSVAGDITIGGTANDQNIYINPTTSKKVSISTSNTTTPTSDSNLEKAALAVYNDDNTYAGTVASFWGKTFIPPIFAGAFLSEGSIAIPRVYNGSAATPVSPNNITQMGLGCKFFVRNSPAVVAPNWKLQLCIQWPGEATPVVIAESPLY